MKRILPIAALIVLLAGCATAPPTEANMIQQERVISRLTTRGLTAWEIDKANDQSEPTACHRDLSSVDAPIRDLTPEVRDFIARVVAMRGQTMSAEYYGVGLSPEARAHLQLNLEPGVYLDPALKPTHRAYILHHEKCHWLTGWSHTTSSPSTPRDYNGKVLP